MCRGKPPSKGSWKLNIPKNYFVKLTGESEEMKGSFDSIRNAIIAAFLLVYMIMAALFESLWQPFVIMFTIPLSVIGVAWSLLFSHTSINAYVLMGFAMLGGIVTNNAIVLIDCINLFLSKNMTLVQAVVTASRVRLRPILMTTFAKIRECLILSYLHTSMLKIFLFFLRLMEKILRVYPCLKKNAFSTQTEEKMAFWGTKLL